MKIKFLGATRQVTGSCHFLDVEGVKILIDCGMFQERDYSYRNWERFPVPPEQIEYVLLTHVHLDHSGLVPKLVREGFAGKILLTSASGEMLPIVLMDSARIQEEDAAFKKKRHAKESRKGPYPEIPLYTVHDVDKCLPLLRPVSYGDYVPLNDRVKVCFHDAGHILGSAMIEVVAQNENGARSIVFSGDVGQYDKPLLNDPTTFKRADYVVMESTYGNRDHEDPQHVDKKLCDIVVDTVKTGGNVLIPTFAIERAQELLYYFGRLAREHCMPYIRIFLDSPMAVEITRVFEHYEKCLDEETRALFKNGGSPFEFPELRLVESTEESKAIDQFKKPAVIMSGSGMITGGRIKHHLARNITNPKATLLFVGYQAAGTLGRMLLDGVSPVRIHGQSYPVRVRIEKIEGFSAHAGMSDFKRWLDGFASPPRRVFLVHGEDDAISSLAHGIGTREGWQVSIPQYLEEYEI
ncbi:MAG: MBL fold metallo-hydrolase [Candidatus Eisenbacteria bacterium]|nr:MBL fold metallo-hydrolase [Candidatus Eisenbacteria bacterium]